MKCAAIEKRIEFHLLKTARSVEALFVTSAGITGGRLAFGLGLSAFEINDVPCHNLEKSEIGTRNLRKFPAWSREKARKFTKPDQ